MILVATPEPDHVPPRVRLDLTAGPGESIADVALTRQGGLVREQPYPGSSASVTFDYEAPFGVPLGYRAHGSVIPAATPEWSELWSDLSAWTGATSSFTASGGKARSTVNGASITRSSAGTIQRVDVAAATFVRVELLSASGSVVASVQVDSKVTLAGVTSANTSGAGGFSLTVSNGIATASAADGSWSLSRSATGTPVKVRLVALGISYPAGIAFSSVGYATGVAVDATGNIYVADRDAKRVRKFNSAGAAVMEFATTGRPSDVAVGSNGSVYVVDIDSNTIRRFNAAGIQTLNVDAPDNAYLYGLAVDGAGNMYASDPGGRVFKLDPGGAVLLSLDAPGNPRSLAVGSNGTIHVADTSNKMVRRYNAAGTALVSIPTTNAPMGLALDGDGNVYVADQTTKTVRRFTPAGSGAQVASIPVPGTPEALAVGPTGTVHVVDFQAKLIKTFRQEGTSVGAVAAIPQAPLTPFDESVATTLGVDEAWLIHPTYSSLSRSIDPGQHRFRDQGINVDATTKTNVGRAARATTHEPPGSRRKVVFTAGPRLAGEWELVLRTRTLAARDEVDALCDDQSPLLLRAPKDWLWDLPDGWYSVGDYSEERTRPRLDSADRRMTLPLTPVNEPTVRLAASWTYGADLLLSGTYSQARATMPTYIDRLVGP